MKVLAASSLRIVLILGNPVKMEVHLPFSHITRTRVVRSQGIVERVHFRDDNKIILVIGAVGSAVAKETA